MSPEDELAASDQQIVDTERRLTEQEQRAASASADSAAEAWRLVANIREALEQLYRHRALILGRQRRV